MRKVLIYVLLIIAIITATVQAEEANFSASLLTAKDVNCRKCHIDTPHIIHAAKPVNCENCHGDKKSVAIPQCTKCHDGPIHKVHAGKIEKGCEYCHKNITPVHTNLISEAVCSHCHKDLIEVHGKSEACVKCHKSPPEIVKPLKAEGMVLICQNCHPKTSVATIHGDINERQGCYNCHKGASQLNGSEIPHQIHKEKESCKNCHEESGKVVVPQCTKCHDIDKLHAFNKIGKLTSGLTCQVCHPGESKPVEAKKVEDTVKQVQTVVEDKKTEISKEKETQKEEKSIPGFGIASGIVALYIIMRKVKI